LRDLSLSFIRYSVWTAWLRSLWIFALMRRFSLSKIAVC